MATTVLPFHQDSMSLPLAGLTIPKDFALTADLASYGVSNPVLAQNWFKPLSILNFLGACYNRQWEMRKSILAEMQVSYLLCKNGINELHNT